MHRSRPVERGGDEGFGMGDYYSAQHRGTSLQARRRWEGGP